MAERIQLRRSLSSEWTSVNPILADGEPGVERDTHKLKLGDGTTPWNSLPYVSQGSKGDRGDKGDFTFAADLIGTSTSSLTLGSAIHDLIVDTGKSWVPGMFICIAHTANSENYMIGMCKSYNQSTGALSVKVVNAIYGTGTYSDWTVSYAASAGSSVVHGNTHVTGGYDEIPIATELSSGLIDPFNFQKINNININGIYIQDTQPEPFPDGAIWFCTSEIVYTAPVISPIYPQYSLPNVAIQIPIYIDDAYDVNLVFLTVVSSSATEIIPLSSVSFSGVGNTRFLNITERSAIGSSILTIVATGNMGVTSSIPLVVSITDVAHTIHISSDSNGVALPTGNITVAHGEDLFIQFLPNNQYAVDTYTLDDVPYPAEDTLTLSNITTDHTISIQFALGFAIIATASAHGTIHPSGIVTVPTGGSKTFTIAGDNGYVPNQLFIDNNTPVAAGNSYTFNAVTTSHSIAVDFAVIKYTVDWDLNVLGGGKIENSYTGSTLIPYGTPYTFTINALSTHTILAVYVNNVSVGQVSQYTIPSVTADTTLSAAFLIKPPSSVSPSIVIGDESLLISWAASTPVPATSYSIYYLEGYIDETPSEIVTMGTLFDTIVGLETTIIGLTNGSTYGVVVVASNANETATYSPVVSGAPSANITPTSTIVTTLPTIETGKAVYLGVNCTTTTGVSISLDLGSAQTGLFEFDWYIKPLGPTYYRAKCFMSPTTNFDSATYLLIDYSDANFRCFPGGSTSNGHFYGYGFTPAGWHRVSVNITADSNAEILMDGIKVYHGTLHISSLRAIKFSVNVANIANTNREYMYIANLKKNGTALCDFGSQGSWVTPTTDGVFIWGL